MTDKVVKAAKKSLGIKSPSRRMAAEVGSQIGPGVGVGVVDSIPAAVAAVRQLSDATVDAWSPSALDIPVRGGSGSVQVDLSPATIQALAQLIAKLLVAGLWPTARAADVVSDLAANGPSRRRRGHLPGGV